MQLDFLRALLPRPFAAPPKPAAAPPHPASPPASRDAPSIRAAVPLLTAPLAEKDPLLEKARALLTAAGAAALAARVAIRWNPRMRSTAGTAWPTKSLVMLNPRLGAFGEAEIDRTLRHELAHLLAHHRAGRRRIAPHGAEWRQACRDLGLPDETRCHTLPLPRRTHARPHAYVCPACGQLFRRVRALRRRTACFACCRRHSGGRYDERFRLVKAPAGPQPAV